MIPWLASHRRFLRQRGVALLIMAFLLLLSSGKAVLAQVNTSYFTDVFANSLGTLSNHVPPAHAVWADPDGGPVFLSSYFDEAGKAIQSYRASDGAHVRPYDRDTNFSMLGHSITGNASYIYVDMKSEGRIRCYRRDNGDIVDLTPNSNEQDLNGLSSRVVGGLALDAARNLLFVSDDDNADRILIFRTNANGTLTALTNTTFVPGVPPNPERLRVDSTGNLWVVERQEGRDGRDAGSGMGTVRCYQRVELNGGTRVEYRLTQTLTLSTPRVSIGGIATYSVGADAYLLVADQGEELDIKIYRYNPAQPTSAELLPQRLGETGGYLNGVRGTVTPTRFTRIVDLSADTAGNVYVLCNPWSVRNDHKIEWPPGSGNIIASDPNSWDGEGCDLRKFTRTGTVSWEYTWNRRSMVFLGVADFDTTTLENNRIVLYSGTKKFTYNPLEPQVGKGWDFVASTVDAFRYRDGEPKDPRLGFGGVNDYGYIRHLSGQKFLFATGQREWTAEQVYRFEDKGRSEISVYSFNLNPDYFSYAIAPNGDQWGIRGNYTKTIERRRYRGLSSDGTLPEWESPRSQTIPAIQGDPVIRIARVDYLPPHEPRPGLVFLSCFTNAFPDTGVGGDDNGIGGRVLACFGVNETGNGDFTLTYRWHRTGTTAPNSDVPWKNIPNPFDVDYPCSYASAGDYLFVAYFSVNNTERDGKILVYDVNTGMRVNTFTTSSPEVDPGPNVDGHASIRAAIRYGNPDDPEDDLYLVTKNNYYLAAMTLYRWQPNLGVLTAPQSLAARFNPFAITWKGVPRATGYRVERSQSGENWQVLAANLPASRTFYTDNSVQPGKTYRYRVQSLRGTQSSSYSYELSVTIPLTLTLPAVADAFVRDGVFATANFGNASTLVTQEHSTAGNRRRAYLKFSTAAVPGNSRIVNAELWLQGGLSSDPTTPVTTSVFGVRETGWSETTINWQNKPALGSTLASASIRETTPRYWRFDITAYLQAEREAKRPTVSVGLRNVSPSRSQTVWSSREASGNSPVLVVQYIPLAPSGSLLGSGTSLTGNATTNDLNTLGRRDWLHFGYGSPATVNRKSGANLLSDLTITGSAGQNSDNDPVFAWTGGIPTASATGVTGGIFVGGTGNGFSLTAPADTTVRTLRVFVYGWGGRGKLEATLSDNSASPYSDVTAWQERGDGAYYALYTLTYNALSAGQTLRVSWTLNQDNGGGAAGIQACALQ